MAEGVRRRTRVAHVASIDLTMRVLLLPQLRRLRDEGFEVTAISAPGPSVRELEKEGIRHIPWTATRSWDPVADMAAFRELIAILRREHFDLVHTHNAKPGVMGRVAARLLRVPCVMNTVHGFDARPDDRLLKRFAFMSMEWTAARFSHAELYQSSADLARARRLRMNGTSKVALIGNGIDLTRLDPRKVSTHEVGEVRRTLGIPRGSLVVGTVGRLVGDKGYRELFEAAPAVRREFPNVVFLAVGDRDHSKTDAIRKEEIVRASDHVIFAGWREDMPALYALMDVFVLASWREGMPRSPMEAAAMARPLVLSDIPGCRQIGQEGVEACFVPPRNPKSLASVITSLLADGELRARMGTAARMTALERFDERQVAEKVANLSKALLLRRALRTAPPISGVRV